MNSKPKTQKSSAKAGQTGVIGTWNLISAEDKDPTTGKWKKYTFGNPPSGYFIYDATGHASIQIMTTPPVKLATPDSPTPDEALEIFNNYIAYYGTYTVDESNITVQVAGAWDPSQVGTAQVRPYELRGNDELIIGDQVTYKRVLKRFK
jgi:lipocalin-like protein